MGLLRHFDQLLSRLTGVLRVSDQPVLILHMALRAIFWGAALYLALGRDPLANIQLNVISCLMAVVWAYFDGIISKRNWRYALGEGILLHFVGVQVSNLFIVLIGNPLS